MYMYTVYRETKKKNYVQITLSKIARDLIAPKTKLYSVILTINLYTKFYFRFILTLFARIVSGQI